MIDKRLERPIRLELTLRAWKALVLPLHHGRVGCVLSLSAWNEKRQSVLLRRKGQSAFQPALDLIDEDNPIHGTDLYWRLHDAKINS